jgi:hypothetical protein
MIDPREITRITEAAENEVDRWSDGRFGGVDLPGHQAGRDFQTKNVGTDSDTDPRFSPLDYRGSSHSIRAAVEELARDPQVREQIAIERGNTDELEKIEQEQAEAAVWEFRRRNPTYFKSELNWYRMASDMARKWLGWLDIYEIDPDEAYGELARRGHWTADNLTATYKSLMKAGVLEVDPESARPLIERDKRAIALQAAAGDVEGAVTRYLQLRLPEQISEMWRYSLSPQDALDGIADPAFKQIVTEAVWYCWEHGRPNYSPSSERRKFMQSYVAGRIATARLLDEAWRACQEAERDASRSGILAQTTNEPTYGDDPMKQLDALDDVSVDRLYHATLRKYAETSRPGILA